MNINALSGLCARQIDKFMILAYNEKSWEGFLAGRKEATVLQLIIAEKPAVAKAISAVIPGRDKAGKGFIEKGDYTITWAMGHLLTLKDPEDYDPEYKKWSLDALPLYFPDWGMKPNEQGGPSSKSKEQLETIGKLLKKADSVIHAGDPDDEGQYLVDEILRWHKYKGPVYRINTNDTSASALQRALNNLEDNGPLEKIGWAAHARSVADIIVGYNCSRYFTLKNPGTLLTVGRVQTAALGLVVLRDLAIEGHTKQVYYTVSADLSIADAQVKAGYEPNAEDPNLVDGRILKESYAKEKADWLTGQHLDVVKVSFAEDYEHPPLPFNLTELQLYCSRKFGYEPSRVLGITQTLRDQYEAITYNRSDCQYLSEAQYQESGATMAQVIKNISFNPKGMDLTIHSRCFDDSNLTAHTAIIPQNKAVDPSKMTEEERTVYLAICKFYMAQFYPPAKKGRTKLEAPLEDGGRLTATSTALLGPGYRYLFKSDKLTDDESNPVLSGIAPGNYPADVLSAAYEAKETKPPARYTKASLGKDMTRIAKYVEDPEVKALLLAKDKGKKGENGSIGTVATRADIIDRLEEHGYLEVSKKKLISTPLGRELYRILPDQLKKPDMTAYWWAIQEDIKQGKVPWTALTESVLDMVKAVIHTEYPSVDMSIIPDKLKRSSSSAPATALGVCPRCGGSVVEFKNSFSCSNYRSGCKFTIWKKSKMPMMAKTSFTKTDVKKFLAGQGVKKSKLLKKNGDTFSATLVMEDDPNSPYGPKFVFAPSVGGGGRK